MGFLKKIFKPISKVLDKIIPNEIKPALPYLAAFTPYMLGPGFGSGFGSGIFSNPATQKMMARGLFSGGANALSQLSQEGNEGDINALSLALSAGQGALTAPGASDYFNMRGELAGEGTGIMSKAKQLGFNTLGKSAGFLSNAKDTLSNPGLNLETLVAAAPAISQGTGDLMYQEGVNAQRDYEKALLDYENSLAEGQFASDSGRREAIINAMTGNHTQEVIDQTLAELGLRNGGIISLQNGGRINFRGGGMDASQPDFGGIEEAIKNVDMKEKEDMMSDEEYITIMGEDGPIRIKKSDYESMPGMFMDTTTSLYGDAGRGRPVPEFANGGIMNGYNMGGSVLPQGMEMDYRGGGFIPMGSKERADDVPARVSKNEFVMTADAVRAAGGGSVNQGAKKMYDLMNNLEARA